MKIKNITTTTAQVYKLRFDNGYYAHFTFDETSEREGRISVASSHGNWSAYWGAMSYPIKTFVQNLDIQYLAQNFGVREVYDPKATQEAFRNIVIELVETNEITLSDATIMHKSINNDIDWGDEAIFRGTFGGYAMDRMSAIYNGFTPHEYIQTSLPHSFTDFFENIWKPFMNHLENQ